MNIFGGRPGIAAGVLAVTAILAAAFCIFAVNVAILISACIFILLCVILFACKFISGYRLFANILVTAVFCTALLRGMNVFYYRAPGAESLCGEDMYLHGIVIEREGGGDYYTNYVIRVLSVNGIECNEKAKLVCEYNSELQKGYEFVLRHSVIEFVLDLEEEDAAELVSEGIFLSVTTSDYNDYAILSENNISWTDEFQSLNSYLSAKLRGGVKGEEGRLAAAMLLGDRSALTSRMYRDFSRAGLSHYLAVSGLHVSIITGLVTFLIGKLRIRRTVRNLLIAAFALAYLCLLGFPVSAIRAVIMMITVFVAYSMGDASDSLNSLGIAASIIIIIDPCSVFEKSFILSFCATLGIVCFMPLFNEISNKLFESGKRKGENNLLRTVLKKLFNAVFGTLIGTAAALSLTLLAVTFLFGETSVLGFESNLAAALVGTPLLASSLLYLIFGNFPYLGEALEFVITKTARFMLDIAYRLGDERGALLSLTSKGARIVVLVFSIILFILLVIKIKHKKLLILAPLSYPLVILAITMIASSSLPTNTELTVYSTGKDEVMLAACGGESAIIDISDGSLTRLDTASVNAHENGITEFDTLILTHYHTKHLSSVSRFIDEEKLRHVILPYPETEDDAWIMVQLVDVLQSSGISCEIAHPNTEKHLVGDAVLTLSPIKRLERSNHPILYFTISEREERITYVSGSAWEDDDFKSDLGELIYESDILLFGAHGPVIKVNFDLPINTERIENCVIFGVDDVQYIIDPTSDDLNEIGLFTGRGAYKITLNYVPG